MVLGRPDARVSSLTETEPKLKANSCVSFLIFTIIDTELRALPLCSVKEHASTSSHQLWEALSPKHLSSVPSERRSGGRASRQRG